MQSLNAAATRTLVKAGKQQAHFAAAFGAVVLARPDRLRAACHDLAVHAPLEPSRHG